MQGMAMAYDDQRMFEVSLRPGGCRPRNPSVGVALKKGEKKNHFSQGLEGVD